MKRAWAYLWVSITSDSALTGQIQQVNIHVARPRCVGSCEFFHRIAFPNSHGRMALTSSTLPTFRHRNARAEACVILIYTLEPSTGHT